MFYIFSIRFNTKNKDNYDNLNIFIARKPFFCYERDDYFVLQLCQDIDYSIKIKEHDKMYVFIVFTEHEKNIKELLKEAKILLDKLKSNLKSTKQFSLELKNNKLVQIASLAIDYNMLKSKYKYTDIIERYLLFDSITEYKYKNFILCYLSVVLPDELIHIILDYLKIFITVKFNLYKMKYLENTYVFRLPYLKITKTDLQIIKTYNK
jgi:hypothetical protein